MAASTVPGPKVEPRVVNRWLQMIAGVVAMMAIANLQYAWTLFTTPLTKNMHVNPGGRPGGICGFCPVRNLAGAIRGLPGRSPWSSLGHRYRWHPGRPWMDRLRICDYSDQLYIWYALGGIGCRRCLWRMHGQLAEVVPRSPRPLRRLYRRCVWHGNRTHRGADCDDDESLRVPAYVCYLGHHSGHPGDRRCHVHRRPAERMETAELGRSHQQGEGVGIRHDALGDDEAAIVLRDLHHDDAGRFRWAGGYGANQTHRHLLPCRSGGRCLGHVGTGAGDRTGPRPKRPLPAILGIGLRSHRPREYHVHRVPESRPWRCWV